MILEGSVLCHNSTENPPSCHIEEFQITFHNSRHFEIFDHQRNKLLRLALVQFATKRPKGVKER